MGVRQATGWLVLGVLIVGGGCARRYATVEVEPTITRTWVGGEPVPPSEGTTPPPPTAAGSGATAAPDPAVMAPAVDPSTPPPAPPAGTTPPTPPVKRGGWVKAGPWNR